MSGSVDDGPRKYGWRIQLTKGESMKIRGRMTGAAILVTAGLLTSLTAEAQWVRPGGRFMAPEEGRWGAPGGSYGYPGGGGYQQGGYPPPTSYPPSGGYPPPGGYAPPAGYPPPGGSPPPGAYASPLPAGAPQASGPGSSAPTYAGPAPYAYPQKGQSPQQVTADQGQCASWATQQTGYNPSAPAAATPTSAISPGRSIGLFGGVSRREERREERRREWEQSSASAPNPQQTDAYNRALDACLSARGYTVR